MKRRGRLLNHIHLKVRNINRSREFYRSVIESLGKNITFDGADCFCVDELFVSESDVPSQSIHLSFKAQHPAAVKLFYQTAIEHGGTCHGQPGSHQNQIGHYSAFVLDPDGNKIEAVFQGATVSNDYWGGIPVHNF